MKLLGEPLAHEAHSTYPAYHHEGERRQASIRYIVVHVAEAPTAEGVARYFMEPGSGGSANLVVDWKAAYRCLGDNVIPWGAPPLNTMGWHIEHAGYAAWTRAKWLTPLNRRTIARGAYKAALRCKWYGIPPVLLDENDLRRFDNDGQPANPGARGGGIVRHFTINHVYHQSDHTCPGTNFPIDVWMQDLNKYLAKL